MDRTPLFVHFFPSPLSADVIVTRLPAPGIRYSFRRGKWTGVGLGFQTDGAEGRSRIRRGFHQGRAVYQTFPHLPDEFNSCTVNRRQVRVL